MPKKPQSKGKISSSKPPTQKPKPSIRVVDGGGKSRWIHHTDADYAKYGGVA